MGGRGKSLHNFVGKSCLQFITKCPNVPSEILIPCNVWSDKVAYEAAARKLASLFAKNFATYEGGMSAEVKAAGPNV
jgi:phosphoenolpyruvate carboxykinase (ATP)